MIEIAIAIGAVGLLAMLIKRTVLGMLVGIQLLLLGSTFFFILMGVVTDSTQGFLFGFFVVLSGVIQVVAGYALALKLFSLKGSTKLENLRTLKN